jgi:SNF2 family DNA or RNA helicase
MSQGKINTSDDGKRFFIKGSIEVVHKVLNNVPGAKPTKIGGAHVMASPSAANDIVQALQGIDMEYDDAWLAYWKDWDEAHRKAEIARLAPPEVLDPFKSATEPWLHQIQAYHFLKALPSGALFSDMGTGKTKVMVDLVCNDEKMDNVLIIGPLKAVEDGLWSREFEKHGYKWVDVVELGPSEGKVRERAETIRGLFTDPYRNTPTVAVINYETLDQEVMRDVLSSIIWDLVVLDESHRIKAVTGQRSKYLGKLGREVQRRLILTGTPNADKPIDVWGQFRFLEPTIFGNYTGFKRRYCVTQLRMAGGHYFEEILGYQNLDELADRMASIAFRVTSDVLDLPDQHDVVRVVRLSDEALRVYRRMEEDALGAVEESTDVIATNILTKYLRLQEITSGYLRSDLPSESGVDSEGGDSHRHADEGEEGELGNGSDRAVRRFDTSKADATAEIVADIDSEEPVVIFHRFTQDAQILHEWLGLIGRHVYELSGRRNDLDVWKKSEGGAVLLVNIAAGAEAIDLTKAAYCLFYSTDFSRSHYEQARKRLHRPGQERPVIYYHVQAEGTVDEYIWEALQTKQDIAQTIEGRIVAKHGN